jgi:hypothetical protein
MRTRTVLCSCLEIPCTVSGLVCLGGEIAWEMMETRWTLDMSCTGERTNDATRSQFGPTARTQTKEFRSAPSATESQEISIVCCHNHNHRWQPSNQIFCDASGETRLRKINFKKDTVRFRLVQTLSESNSHTFSIAVLYCEKIGCPR